MDLRGTKVHNLRSQKIFWSSLQREMLEAGRQHFFVLWLELCLGFRVAAGHHIPAPTWEGCRATLQTLLSCSALPTGGCRSSGWALVLLAVVLLALVLCVGLFVWSLSFVSLCEGADPRNGSLPQVSPSMFWDFGSLHQKHRESAGPWL